MNLLGKIFGSDNVIDKAVDGIYNGVDKLIYTDEEKSEDRISNRAQHAKLMTFYEPFKLIQRWLAMSVVATYLIGHLVALTLMVIGIFQLPESLIPNAAEELAKFNRDTLSQPVIVILAFYFAGGALEGFIRTKNNK